MIPRKPWYFTDGSTLEASRLMENFRLSADDVNAALQRRYVYSSFTLDFSGLNDTDAAIEFFYSIPTFYAFDVVGVEMELYTTTNVTAATLTFNGVGVTGDESTALAGAGATTRAHTYNSFTAHVASSGLAPLLTVTASSTPWTLTACRVTFHIRFDRGNVGSSYNYWYPTTVAVPGMLTDSTTFSAETSLGSIASLASQNALTRPRFEVFTRRNISAGAMAASDQDMIVPASGRQAKYIVIGLVCPATSSMRVGFRNPTTELMGVTVTGTGVTTFTFGVGGGSLVGSSLIISTGASDDLIRIARVTGTDAIPFVYALVYWER